MNPHEFSRQRSSFLFLLAFFGTMVHRGAGVGALPRLILPAGLDATGGLGHRRVKVKEVATREVCVQGSPPRDEAPGWHGFLESY